MVLLLWFTINRKPYIGFTNHLVYYYGSFSFVFYLCFCFWVSSLPRLDEIRVRNPELFERLYESMRPFLVDGSEMPTVCTYNVVPPQL